MSLNDFLAEALSRDGLHFQPEFYRYVYDTIVYTSRKENYIDDKKANYHLSPKKICSLINNRLKAEFGELTEIVLKEWGVKSSRDIGIVVFQLADASCLKLWGNETLEEFEAGGLHI